MSGYEVDLSYLQDSLKKLQAVADGLDDANTKAKYQTDLGRSQVGSDMFIEAGNLHAAHDTMKTQLSAMVLTLQQMIQEFTDKTGSAHDQYAAQETDTGHAFTWPA